MNIILKKWLVFILLSFSMSLLSSQQIQESTSLNNAKLEPFKLEVTYSKTTHLIFPSPIRYVDLGSENLIANKAEDVGNVLRIKAGINGFEEETNFSVITQDGKFYNFDVLYSPYPDTLNYDLLKLHQTQEKEYSTDVQFEELKGNSSSLNEAIMKTLYENPKRTITHIGVKSFGIRFLLKSLYIYGGKFYFIFQMTNKSNISYDIDFINFKIVDKKNLKRTIIQEKILTPLRIYPIINAVSNQASSNVLYLLDQFTLFDDQILEIEVFEKNGGRHQKIEVENIDLINAKIVRDIHLKMK